MSLEFLKIFASLYAVFIAYKDPFKLGALEVKTVQEVT